MPLRGCLVRSGTDTERIVGVNPTEYVVNMDEIDVGTDEHSEYLVRYTASHAFEKFAAHTTETLFRTNFYSR